MYSVMKLGLCEGRHRLPEEVTGCIFPVDFFDEAGSMFDFGRIYNRLRDTISDADELHLWVTGPTSALTSVISFCLHNHKALVLYHYNWDTGKYVKQIL